MLARLAVYCQETTTAITAVGALPALVRLLQSSVVEVKQAAVDCIAALSSGLVQEDKDANIAAGALLVLAMPAKSVLAKLEQSEVKQQAITPVKLLRTCS